MAVPSRRRPSVLELAILTLSGATASAATNLLHLRLGIPGSNIVFVAFPLALGFALVPRRGAGWMMGGSAILTNLLIFVAGHRLDGLGAQTSLLLTGPFLDIAVGRASNRRHLYLAFVIACAASNAMAFLVRGWAKAAGLRGGGGGGRSFAAWWPQAIWTYAAAGMLAGFISAAAWFQLRERSR